MKRVRGMMYPRRQTTKLKKYTCCKCGKELTPSTAYFYVDGCNCAITDNAQAHCKECYISVYGKH